MARRRNATPSDDAAPAGAPRLRRALAGVTCVLVLSAGLAVALHRLYRHVDRQLTMPAQPPRLVLAQQPPWISPTLVTQLLAGLTPDAPRSSFDQKLLQGIAQDLSLSPWVRKVRQVRRVFGQGPGDTIVIDAEFRVPAALVMSGERFWLIDSEGYQLPEQYRFEQLRQIMFTAAGKLNLRIVQGVASGPGQAGELWPGDDVAAGLDLVKLLHQQPFAEEIQRIDVSNFGGRVDRRAAQLVLLTRTGSIIRWGRPINASDFYSEIPAAQKLAVLQRIHEQFGRVDAGQPWVDIRFDQVLTPAPDELAAHPQGAESAPARP